MKINSVGEFYNFVKNNGLVGLSTEVTSLMVCMEEFGRMCACDPISDKIAKENQCKALYVAFAVKAGQYKKELFKTTKESSIILCVNGQQLITLNR